MSPEEKNRASEGAIESYSTVRKSKEEMKESGESMEVDGKEEAKQEEIPRVALRTGVKEFHPFTFQNNFVCKETPTFKG